MPLIVKDGDPTQGHGWPSVPLKATTQSSVKVDGAFAVVVGDTSQPGNHAGCGPGGCDKSPDHPVATAGGSPTVFIEGIAVVRDADPLSCGDVADTPPNTVFADGLGNQPLIQPTLAPSPFETIGYFVRSITDSYSVTLPGRITTQTTGFNPPTVREFWNSWRPQALTPKPSNGFRITLVEEGSGRTFTSLQGIGATNLPEAATPIFKEPLDNAVSYQVLQGPFSADNSGALTLNPSFVPGRNPSNDDKLVRTIPVKVRVNYNQGIISKTISFEVTLNLTTA
tara:strand:- start:23 stop:868 length:846 start_codon:yes stop_codon:yes gene_type:complete